jgi:hypothetical protein
MGFGVLNALVVGAESHDIDQVRCVVISEYEALYRCDGAGYTEKPAGLVTSCGTPPTGPRSAIPMNPAVLVPTPSMGFPPDSNSSTYTPGDKYSAIKIAFTRHADKNRSPFQFSLRT